MDRFAAATPPLGEELGWPALPWLAGLLEAEGTFLAPPPTMPNCPIVACRMTDRDVIERVAFMFGRKVYSNGKGRHKTEFGSTIKGAPAAALMRVLRPLMGDRRQAAIDRALALHTPRETKLGPEAAKQIRLRHLDGETKAELARAYRVSHHTIREIIAGRIYCPPRSGVWMRASQLVGAARDNGAGFSWQELYWIAGWLEGEGTFTGPAPSSPVSVRLAAQATDADVVAEVARLLGVTAQYSHTSRARAKGWSPMWRVLLRGERAHLVMDAIEPLMGSRRRAQIENARCLANEAIARKKLER